MAWQGPDSPQARDARQLLALKAAKSEFPGLDPTMRTMNDQGVTSNSNGTAVGVWQPSPNGVVPFNIYTPDMKGVRPRKSTGDMAPQSPVIHPRVLPLGPYVSPYPHEMVANYIAQRRQARTPGYY